MRIKSQKQLYFKMQSAEIDPSCELEVISKTLDSLPGLESILNSILNDISQKKTESKAGAEGMTAEQVLRSLIVRKLKNYSYRELGHASRDSISVRSFLKISSFENGFKYKTFQGNIKRLSEASLDLISEAIKRFAVEKEIDDGSQTRTDGFSTSSNIHYPTDWSLMNDSIRVLSRTMTYAHEDFNIPLCFTNHYRSSKKKLFKIHNSKNLKKKKKWNLELIRLTRATLKYAQLALPEMESFKENLKDPGRIIYFEALIADLKHFIPLVEKVIDQAHRRIVKGEKVASSEKIVSIFEEHTDIIAKGSRDVVFGHKQTITTGKSGLVLDIQIHEGNPADSTLVKEVIERHKRFYGESPKSAVFDGCYSSNENREFAKEEKIENVCFSKETDSDSSCTKKVRRVLRNFRAGIEATVSMLKRMFGLTRIMDKGIDSYKASAKASVITYNLFILARIQLKV